VTEIRNLHFATKYEYYSLAGASIGDADKAEGMVDIPLLFKVGDLRNVAPPITGQ